MKLSRSLLETLGILAARCASLSTTEILDLGWVGRSAFLRRLNKLLELGLVSRDRVKGTRGYVWTVKAKGIVLAGTAAKAARSAA